MVNLMNMKMDRFFFFLYGSWKTNNLRGERTLSECNSLHLIEAQVYTSFYTPKCP